MIRLIFFCCFFPLVLFGQNNNTPKQRPNVLFIAIDDLRPELGCYGSPIAVTPNMDKLAQRGVIFQRAYCSQSLCCPARTSLLTGVRPETSGIIDNYTDFRNVIPNVITLPQIFWNNGYETTYIGKVYEPQFSDHKFSWSKEPVKPNYKEPNPVGGYVDPANIKLFKSLREEMTKKYGDRPYFGLGRGPAFESPDVPDNAYTDGYNADVAIATMQSLAKQDKPFFLAVGFQDPHLDFNAPKKYWDLYDESKIPLPSQTEPPLNAATMGVPPNIEIRDRYGIPKIGPIDTGTVLLKKLKHGYLAATSYVDALIGKIVNEVDALGLSDNTIIVLWGDQGYHVGEMGLWGKSTNYEVGTRVPLIFAGPGVAEKNKGVKINGMVEQVDIYPTLCDLADITKPKDQLQGISFLPLLSSPDLLWKKAVFSMSPTPAFREWGGALMVKAMHDEYFIPLMNEVEAGMKAQMKEKYDKELFQKYLIGYTMRTDRFRLILWKDSRTLDNKPIFTELYDYRNSSAETINIANENPKLVKKLSKQFHKGWKGNLPKSLQ